MDSSSIIYFVISGIHSCYTELLQSLRKSSFRKNNENHILIVCGDVFGKGADSVKTYKFLYSIPKQRRILIRGEYEFMLQKVVERGHFTQKDKEKGVKDIVLQFVQYYYPNLIKEDEKQICQAFANLGIVRWILSEEWANYYCIQNYFFIHKIIFSQTDIKKDSFFYRDHTQKIVCGSWEAPNLNTNSDSQDIINRRVVPLDADTVVTHKCNILKIINK